MNVCSNCFTENELKAFINTSTTFGNCDVCESQTVALIDLDELMDFFSELISNFELNESGTPLINKLQVDWNFFSTNDIGNSIINHALEEMESEILSSNIKVGFSSQILENVNYWEKLKEELKWSKRFVTNIDFLTKELAWDRYFGSEFLLNPDVSLYRARLHKDADQNAYNIDKMHSPPKDKVTNGRANPSGIPFLYLSKDQETPLYEVRATLLDELSLGEFKLKEAEDPIKIVDFTTPTPLFYTDEGSVSEQIKSHLLKQKISSDLSKPMRKYDSDVEYIPTQFICEFIKVFTGAEGIQFRSSVRPEGKNLVIFNQNKIDCIKVQVKQIARLKLTSKNRD